MGRTYRERVIQQKLEKMTPPKEEIPKHHAKKDKSIIIEYRVNPESGKVKAYGWLFSPHHFVWTKHSKYATMRDALKALENFNSRAARDINSWEACHEYRIKSEEE